MDSGVAVSPQRSPPPAARVGVFRQRYAASSAAALRARRHPPLENPGRWNPGRWNTSKLNARASGRLQRARASDSAHDARASSEGRRGAGVPCAAGCGSGVVPCGRCRRFRMGRRPIGVHWGFVEDRNPNGNPPRPGSLNRPSSPRARPPRPGGIMPSPRRALKHMVASSQRNTPMPGGSSRVSTSAAVSLGPTIARCGARSGRVLSSVEHDPSNDHT